MKDTGGRRYDLLEPIAAGGMGEVFVGRVWGEHGFQKPVAIKRILPELAHDPEFVVRFVAEAKLAVSLSHANVVQVFDLGRTGDELLLVMEYVRGTDLARLLAKLAHQRHPTPVAVGVYLALETLRGLIYAHERRDVEGGIGVIHCDVSPSNLLISWAGEIKIGDFGVAQALDVARRTRQTGGVRGKVRYMAPEQLLGEPLDARTDLYSLAVVLYEMLTAQRPFDLADSDAIAAAVIAGGLPSLATLRPEVPEALDRLLARAMARQPAQRPASAREMLVELTRIAQKLDPVTAPDVGSWAQAASEGASAGVPAGGRVATVSAVAHAPSRNPTMSFVVSRTVDGVTLLKKRPIAPPRARTWAPWAGLALGACAFVGLFAWRSPSAHVESPRLLAPASPTAQSSLSLPSPPPSPTPSVAVPPPPTPSVAAPPPPTPSVAAPPPPPTSTPSVAAPRPPTSTTPVRDRAARRVAASKPVAVEPRDGATRHLHPAAPGFVNVYAEPWAQVFVDGKSAGSTPLPRLPLPPGLHRVRLANPRAGSTERLVRITTGKTELLDVDLDTRP